MSEHAVTRPGQGPGRDGAGARGGRGWTTRVVLLLALVATALFGAGCGDSDPGALGPQGVDGGLSSEGKKQEYVQGVSRALAQLATSQNGKGYAQAVNTGSKRQLQIAALAWQQGGAQLKQLDPPADAVAAHEQLIAAVGALSTWNTKIVAAAPNKARTKQLAKQAAVSPASQAYEASVCKLVDAGYEVIDPTACSPLDAASSPVE